MWRKMLIFFLQRCYIPLRNLCAYLQELWLYFFYLSPHIISTSTKILQLSANILQGNTNCTFPLHGTVLYNSVWLTFGEISIVYSTWYFFPYHLGSRSQASSTINKMCTELYRAALWSGKHQKFLCNTQVLQENTKVFKYNISSHLMFFYHTHIYLGTSVLIGPFTSL